MNVILRQHAGEPANPVEYPALLDTLQVHELTVNFVLQDEGIAVQI